MPNYDDIANGMYGVPFDALSAFGQREVIAHANRNRDDLSFEHIDMTHALRAAQEKIARLERENLDLWEENEDLRFELYGGEDEDSLGGNRGQRQARSRVRATEVLPDVSAQAPGISQRIDGEDTSTTG